MAPQIDYDKLVAFLRGEVSREDLKTKRFTKYDIAVIIHALMIARLDELTYAYQDERFLKASLINSMNLVFPEYVLSSSTDASKRLGLHYFTGRELGTKLTPSDRFVDLVERYKDDPNGGIAKFTALKTAKKDTGKDDITPQHVANDVMARLRRCYSPEVLDVIRKQL